MQTILNNNAPVAQGIEQLPSKQWVRGSIPRGRAISKVIFFLLVLILISNTLRAEEPLELFLGGNESEAIEIWKEQSILGDIDASYALGIIFYDSDVTGLCQRIDDSFCKENFKTGIKFFKIGHAAGDPRATYALGEHYDILENIKKHLNFIWRLLKKEFLKHNLIQRVCTSMEMVQKKILFNQ